MLHCSFAQITEAVLRDYGYNLVLLPSVDQGAVDAGLKYVNNDICYPSILTVGQIMEAIESFHGKKTLVIIAHRLRTIAGCDIIYKVDNGKSVETTLAAEEH